MHILRPLGQEFLQRPPLFYTSPPLEGCLQGWGVGVYKIWPCREEQEDHRFPCKRRNQMVINVDVEQVLPRKGYGLLLSLTCLLKRIDAVTRPSLRLSCLMETNQS